MKKATLLSLCAGCLFAVGMYLADLERPANILGAFQLGRQWDPRLMSMFVGTQLVQWPVTRLLRARGKTMRERPLRFTHHRAVDLKLCLGALLFGVGWGLGGICPGPGMTAALTGGSHVVMFLATFLIGLRVADRVTWGSGVPATR